MKNLLTIFILIAGTTLVGSAQTPQKCAVSKNTGGKFKLKYSSYSLIDQGNVLFLTVKVKPGKLNTKGLTEIGRRIGETYCRENYILAEIQDSSIKLPKLDDIMPPRPFGLATKWVYSIDRKKGEEEIVAVSEDGKIDKTHRIDLARK